MTAERDPLEEILLREPYIDDAGFTDRVMGSLPPRRRDLRPLARGLSIALAAALAMVFLPGALTELAVDLRGAVAGLATAVLAALPGGVSPSLAAGALACLAAAALGGAALGRIHREAP